MPGLIPEIYIFWLCRGAKAMVDTRRSKSGWASAPAASMKSLKYFRYRPEIKIYPSESSTSPISQVDLTKSGRAQGLSSSIISRPRGKEIELFCFHRKWLYLVTVLARTANDIVQTWRECCFFQFLHFKYLGFQKSAKRIRVSECLYRVGSEEDNEACRRSQLSLHRQIGNRGPFSGTFVTITMSFTSDDSLSSAVIFFVF